ncbi:MAG TPA: multicopper oxidase family protein [Solirubrobacterales bacterium]|nr:multicopper oxidase family protein [Solirubrobacterales bacterium]
MPGHEPEGRSAAARFGRRAFVTVAGAGGLALLLPVRSGRQGLLSIADSISRASGRGRFHAKLPIPRVLSGADIHIPIRVAEVRILPGRKTRMWTYAGTFPGPTIRRRAGHRTKVTFHHRLPRKAGELTVHLHGGHSESRYDGQPGGLTRSQKTALYCDVTPGLSAKQSGNNLLIKPGRRHSYVYDLVEDGSPERSAFQWYHDHRLEHTGRNVWRGLAGMWILDDDFDESLPLPSGRRDIPLLIVDRSFDAHNQLTNPFSQGRHPPTDGITGKLVLVNGAWRPHKHVSARRHRLRFLNASNFRAYNLYLSDGTSLVQVASDSGLMPAPVERQKVLLAPAERAEVIVDFSHAAGRSVELRSSPHNDDQHALGTRPFKGALMQFRVGRRRPDSTSIPAALRPLPDWVASAHPSPDRTWVISIGGTGLTPSWLINGKRFDPARSDAFPALGSTETWAVTNNTGVAHVIHMHSTDWYMLSRNGQPPRPWEDCLKESFFINPGDTIHVAAYFSDYLGKFVIHCHMLDHEDHGLMDQFEVVASKAAQPASDEVARRRRGEIPRYSKAPTLGLPGPGRVRGRRLEFTPSSPRGERLRWLEVAVNGEPKRAIQGPALGRPVRLGLPGGGLARVTLVGHTEDDRMIGVTRDYETPSG